MRIAIIGGGTRCLYLMEMIRKHKFHEISPVVVAVAEIKDDTPALFHAKQRGLFTTHDYNDFFKREDIDLIVELTGNLDIYNDILQKKARNVRAIAHTTALLFWEISNSSDMHKKVDRKLQETQALYYAMSNDMIQEDMMVIGLDYRIQDANAAMVKKLGMRRDEIKGRYCYEVTHRLDKPCSGDHHPCPLLQAVEFQKPTQTTHIHLDKAENELHVSISCYPLIEDGKVAGVIEISKDISQDIRVQKAMMQQEKMVSIGRLSAGVAHEINNPLTTILTSSMLAQEELEPDHPVYEELQTIANEAMRCRKIVKSLLDFARHSEPVKKDYNLNEIVQESFILTRKQAAFKDIEVHVNLSEQLPAISVDKDQIQQVIINLVLNAIEATPPGGNVAITTRYLSSSRKVEVEVKDSGIGIPREIIDKIFDPFFTTRSDGTGLGLSITQGIVEKHDGKIQVKSRPGEGASFCIQLPLNKGEDHDR
ncbi:MAG: ATP-binding protein [Pseudomonadota bacterium]